MMTRAPTPRLAIAALSFAVALLTCGVAGKAQAQSSDHVTVGLGVATAPDFEGADDYRILPYPLLDVQLGQFFANSNGIGVHVIDLPAFTVGGGITYVRGYRRRDVPDGVGKLSDAAGGRLFTSVRLGGVIATLGATRIFGGGTHGTLADARISYPLQANERITIIPTVGTSWANDKHMRRYFGVSSSEAAASGLAPYRPSSGFKDISANLTASYRLTAGLSLTGSAGVIRLLDKAADSPLVERRWQPVGVAGIAYHF